MVNVLCCYWASEVLRNQSQDKDVALCSHGFRRANSTSSLVEAVEGGRYMSKLSRLRTTIWFRSTSEIYTTVQRHIAAKKNVERPEAAYRRRSGASSARYGHCSNRSCDHMSSPLYYGLYLYPSVSPLSVTARLNSFLTLDTPSQLGQDPFLSKH